MSHPFQGKKRNFRKWILRSLRHIWRNVHCVFTSFWIGVIVALLGAVAKYLEMHWDEDAIKKFVPSDDIYKGSTTLVTMMIVFHTAQSYSRFMSGITLVYQMSADFMDTASLLTAFCKASSGTSEDKHEFLNTMVRLFSMLFMSALADLEHGGSAAQQNLDSSRNLDSARDPEEGIRAHRFDLLDPEGLDQETLKTICQSYDKTIAINQRIIDMMMSGIDKKVLSCPPPILGRAFQELGMGMFRFHEALKFKDAPFPVPYIVVADMLMILHSLMTPFVMTRWSDSVPGAMLFSFIPCFSLWALHGIAEELDNPFADGQTNLDAKHMTEGFNRSMLSFLGHASVATSPALSDSAQTLSDTSLTGKLEYASTFWNLKIAVMNAQGIGLTMANSVAHAVDHVSESASRLIPSFPISMTRSSRSSKNKSSEIGASSGDGKLHGVESNVGIVSVVVDPSMIVGSGLDTADVRIECVEGIAEETRLQALVDCRNDLERLASQRKESLIAIDHDRQVGNAKSIEVPSDPGSSQKHKGKASLKQGRRNSKMEL